MEISEIYIIINLIIVSLFYVGLAFAVAWMINKKTRIFGIVFAITWLLLTQVHANILYYLEFNRFPLDYNIIGLVLALTFIVALLVIQYHQLAKDSVAFINKQFGKNIAIGLGVVFVFTVAISLLSMIF